MHPPPPQVVVTLPGPPPLPGCFALAQLCVSRPPPAPLYFQYENKRHFWLVTPAAACSACKGGVSPRFGGVFAWRWGLVGRIQPRRGSRAARRG